MSCLCVKGIDFYLPVTNLQGLSSTQSEKNIAHSLMQNPLKHKVGWHSYVFTYKNSSSRPAARQNGVVFGCFEFNIATVCCLMCDVVFSKALKSYSQEFRYSTRQEEAACVLRHLWAEFWMVRACFRVDVTEFSWTCTVSLRARLDPACLPLSH